MESLLRDRGERVKERTRYIESIYGEDPILEKVKATIIENEMPSISVSPGLGRFLTLLVRLSGAKRILEIGALGGYSGICLARGLGEEGELVSLELKEEYARIAGKNLTEAGLGGRVSYLVGDALRTMASLVEKGETFDFFFIDADKQSYPGYLDYAIQLANPGAIIAADNTFLGGKAMDESIPDDRVKAVRTFNQRIATDDRLLSAMLPAFDGISLAMVK